MFLISFYGIIIIRITPEFDRENPPDPSQYENAKPYNSTAVPAQQYYITAAWDDPDRVPSSFVVGNGSQTMIGTTLYVNARLSSNTEYAYLVQVKIRSDTNEVK